MDYDKQYSEYEKWYNKGIKLVCPHIILDDRPTSEGEFEKDVLEGIDALRNAVAIIPNWAALWFIGKGYQRLDNSIAAAEAFGESWRLASKLKREPNHADILREWGLQLLKLRKFKENLEVAILAREFSPTDSGLQANHALGLLFLGDVQAALKECEEAYNRNNKDKVTAALFRYIQSVNSGKYPVPKDFSDLPTIEEKL